MLFVFIGGASASGKTELAKEFGKTLEDEGIRAVTLSMDHYYKSQQERGGVVVDFDKPEAFNFNLFRSQLRRLDRNEIIERPTYCFIEKNRLDKTERIDPNDIQVVVIEGILALHEINSIEVTNKITVFIESDFYLSYLGRRKKRDETDRNTSAEQTTERELATVRQAFFSHILPTRSAADIKVTNNDNEQGGISGATNQLLSLLKTRLNVDAFPQ